MRHLPTLIRSKQSSERQTASGVAQGPVGTNLLITAISGLGSHKELSEYENNLTVCSQKLGKNDDSNESLQKYTKIWLDCHT